MIISIYPYSEVNTCLDEVSLQQWKVNHAQQPFVRGCRASIHRKI